MTKPIDKLGMGPTRTSSLNKDGSWTVTITPPDWSGFSRSTMRLTGEQYLRYCRWLDYGGNVQDVFPELSANERELLITGISNEELSYETTLIIRHGSQ